MENQNRKFKFDGFHYVMAGAFVFGLLSIVFIFKTAIPKEIKLIKWSDTDQPGVILESLSRIQYPIFKELYSLQINGLKHLGLSPQQTAITIGKVLDLNVTPKASKSLKPSEEELFILNPGSKKNIKIKINYALLKDIDSIAFDQVYDPKSLEKLLKKLEGSILFTAYKINESQIFIDVIQLQSSR